MPLKRIVKGMLGIALVAALTGCGNGSSSSDSSAAAEKEKLVVQFVPTNNDGSMQAKAKPFAEYLSKKLDREVEVTLATDYSTIVEAMASGQVDLGIMPPAAYVQAKDMDAAEAILTSQLGAYDPETGLPLEGKKPIPSKGRSWFVRIAI